jgi:hypothetical protein
LTTVNLLAIKATKELLMFSEDQEVRFKSQHGKPLCRIIAQRHYTERYTHWDIEVIEKTDNFYVGLKMLGIPETSLESA